MSKCYDIICICIRTTWVFLHLNLTNLTSIRYISLVFTYQRQNNIQCNNIFITILAYSHSKVQFIYEFDGLRVQFPANSDRNTKVSKFNQLLGRKRTNLTRLMVTKIFYATIILTNYFILFIFETIHEQSSLLKRFHSIPHHSF